jgi:hypothetical protein
MVPLPLQPLRCYTLPDKAVAAAETLLLLVLTLPSVLVLVLAPMLLPVPMVPVLVWIPWLANLLQPLLLPLLLPLLPLPMRP